MTDSNRFLVITAGEQDRSCTFTSRQDVNGLVVEAENETMEVVTSAGDKRTITVAEFLALRPSLVAWLPLHFEKVHDLYKPDFALFSLPNFLQLSSWI